jgi:hypothetical protein
MVSCRRIAGYLGSVRLWYDRKQLSIINEGKKNTDRNENIITWYTDTTDVHELISVVGCPRDEKGTYSKRWCPIMKPRIHVRAEPTANHSWSVRIMFVNFTYTLAIRSRTNTNGEPTMNLLKYRQYRSYLSTSNY